jgi:predicted RND superfamily exporter protein
MVLAHESGGCKMKRIILIMIMLMALPIVFADDVQCRLNVETYANSSISLYLNDINVDNYITDTDSNNSYSILIPSNYSNEVELRDYMKNLTSYLNTTMNFWNYQFKDMNNTKDSINSLQNIISEKNRQMDDLTAQREIATNLSISYEKKYYSTQSDLASCMTEKDNTTKDLEQCNMNKKNVKDAEQKGYMWAAMAFIAGGVAYSLYKRKPTADNLPYKNLRRE